MDKTPIQLLQSLLNDTDAIPSQYIELLPGAVHTIQYETADPTMTSIPLPKWEPKDKTSPLKEEYTLFYQEAVVYCHTAIGAIEVLSPTITSQIAAMPTPLKTFTDKMKMVISATDLTSYLYEV